jgi:hypothetical protein
MSSESKRGNLILVGGPSSNRLVRELLPRVTKVIAFPQHDLYDTSVQESRRPGGLRSPDHREWVTDTFVDYGIIILAPSPIGEKKWIAIVIGGTGLGTLESAELLASMSELPEVTDEMGEYVQTFYIPVEGGRSGLPTAVLPAPFARGL